jgi:hypothetical protein
MENSQKAEESEFSATTPSPQEYRPKSGDTIYLASDQKRATLFSHGKILLLKITMNF